MRTLFTLAALALSLADANAANFPFIRLNGKTNQISDNGDNPTFNSNVLVVDNSVVNVRNKPWNATGNGTTDDAPAIQAALNYAWGTNNTHTELNKTVYIPPGIYKLGSTLLVTNVRSAKLIGGGKYATILRSDVAGPVLRTDGMWFSEIRSICFRAGVGGNFGLFELDGNIDHLGTTIGVQGNSITDCYFEGNSLPANGLAITPTGWSYGQGSENRIENCHFITFTNAAIYIYGYNAHNNTIIGGNIQGCPNNGIYVDGATSQNVIGMGFQNATTGWPTQVGYDIYTLNTDGSPFNIKGCRSESWHFAYMYGVSTPCAIDGCLVNPSGWNADWTANHSYSLNDIVRPTNALGQGYTFKCTTAGLSGGTDPVWSTTGTITDNAAQWQLLDIVSVRVGTGSVRNSTFHGGSGDFETGQYKASLSVENCSWDFPGWNKYGYAGLSVTGPELIGNEVIDYLGHKASYSQPVIGSSTATMVTNTSQMNLGRSPLLFSAGSDTQSYGDVGLYRNDGAPTNTSDYAVSRNVLGIIGSLGKPVVTNATGDDFVLAGGLGATSGGKIRLMTQRSGATNAVDGLTVDNTGKAEVAGDFHVIGQSLFAQYATFSGTVQLNGQQSFLNHTYFTDVTAGRLNLTDQTGLPTTGALGVAHIFFGTNDLSYNGTNLTWNGTALTVP